MQKIVFRPTADTFGLPDPPVPNGTIVILVQKGKATIGRYEAPTPETPWPAFDHLANDGDLSDEALTAVLAEHPEIDPHGPALVFVRPEGLAGKAVWKS